eukprot:3686735-Rhodomonas_salina.1
MHREGTRGRRGMYKGDGEGEGDSDREGEREEEEYEGDGGGIDRAEEERDKDCMEEDRGERGVLRLVGAAASRRGCSEKTRDRKCTQVCIPE